ncbi:MAG: hypothetical protein QM757_06900 [Paludibaculum sp.]
MSSDPEPRHDLTPNEIDAIEDKIYGHNSRATGHADARGLGFVIRDDAAEVSGPHRRGIRGADFRT